MSAEAKATHQPYIGPYKVLKSNNCILLIDKDGKEEFVHRGHVIKRIKRSPKQDDDVLELMLDEHATQPVAPSWSLQLQHRRHQLRRCRAEASGQKSQSTDSESTRQLNRRGSHKSFRFSQLFNSVLQLNNHLSRLNTKKQPTRISPDRRAVRFRKLHHFWSASTRVGPPCFPG
jgi:hypothetical protein